MGIGTLLIVSSMVNTSTFLSNPPINTATEKYLSFDNSTPPATAISIARLNEGTTGFDENITKVSNAHLTSDEKYWIVNVHEGIDNWIVTIDANTGMSAKNGGDGPVETWRSLDELKALYIAELGDDYGYYGRPQNITLDGKNVWEIPVYDEDYWGKIDGYIYVDLRTGKSIYLEASTGRTGSWDTLKDMDNRINEDSGLKSGKQYRDALRDLYPET